MNDEESDARSHPNLKKPKRYMIISEEEDESGEPEEDKDWDTDYNQFFHENILF